MDFPGFIFFLICFFSCCTSSGATRLTKLRHRDFHSLRDVIRMINDPDRCTTLYSRLHNSAKFLRNYIKANQSTYLEEVFRQEHYIFEGYVFDILINHFDYYTISLVPNPSTGFSNCEKVPLLAHRLFFANFTFEEDLEKRFSTIRLFIKFAKRYTNASFSNFHTREEQKRLSENVGDWEFAMKFLPTIMPSVKIDYDNFLSVFHQFTIFDNGSSQKKKFDSKHRFLLAIIINHIIIRKDQTLFDVDNPDLLFIVVAVLSMLDKEGQSKSPVYDCKGFEMFLQRLLERDRYLTIFLLISEKRIEILPLALDKLKPEKSCSLSELLKLFKARFPESHCAENINIIWQLTGLAFVEEKFKLLEIQRKSKTKAKPKTF
jgi:hypothetical protein